MRKVRIYVCLSNNYISFNKDIAYVEGNYGDDSSHPAEYWASEFPHEWEVLTTHQFKVGQKVICVDATGFLVEGLTYTVESVGNAGLTVKECVVTEGMASYKLDRFIPATVKIEFDWEELLVLDTLLSLPTECTCLDSMREELLTKILKELE